MKRTIMAASVALALSGAWTAESRAAGFALIEQSASGMGNSFAGAAASAEDASTIFFNPAGMTLLPSRQIVIGVHGVRPTASFDDRSSTAAAGQSWAATAEIRSAGRPYPTCTCPGE